MLIILFIKLRLNFVLKRRPILMMKGRAKVSSIDCGFFIKYSSRDFINKANFSEIRFIYSGTDFIV